MRLRVSEAAIRGQQISNCIEFLDELRVCAIEGDELYLDLRSI
ncbi:hypothetical protein [Ruegeria atlantica]|nr:hypothetical protein [Ruegeria atlantica]